MIEITHSVQDASIHFVKDAIELFININPQNTELLKRQALGDLFLTNPLLSGLILSCAETFEGSAKVPTGREKTLAV